MAVCCTSAFSLALACPTSALQDIQVRPFHSACHTALHRAAFTVALLTLPGPPPSSRGGSHSHSRLPRLPCTGALIVSCALATPRKVEGTVLRIGCPESPRGSLPPLGQVHEQVLVVELHLAGSGLPSHPRGA